MCWSTQITINIYRQCSLHEFGTFMQLLVCVTYLSGGACDLSDCASNMSLLLHRESWPGSNFTGDINFSFSNIPSVIHKWYQYIQIIFKSTSQTQLSRWQTWLYTISSCFFSKCIFSRVVVSLFCCLFL